MNEKGLPPALNGDASLEEVFAGLKPSLPPLVASPLAVRMLRVAFHLF